MYKQIAVGCLLISIMGCSTGSGYSTKGDIAVIEESLVSGLKVKLLRNYKTCSSGFYDTIYLDGPIGPDSTYIVSHYLDMAQSCDELPHTSVYLNSRGGLITDGMELGRLFKKKQVITYIIGNDECSSSCAVAFLGGIYRNMHNNASLMFHAPYKKSSYGQEQCASRSQANDLKTYYAEMLGQRAGNTLFDRTMSYCGSNKGWVINIGAARAYGITSD